MMKRFLCLLLIGFLGFSLFAGGGQEESDTPDADSSSDGIEYEWEYMEDTSPITIQLWQNTWPGCRPGVVWDDSLVSQFITQQTGVTLKMEKLEGDENEILAPMIAAGELPEMLATGSFTSPILQQLIEADMVYAISDLIDQYAPKMWDLIPQAYHDYHTAEDGKMWYWPGFMYYAEVKEAFDNIGLAFTSGEGIFYVRKDILKAFGKEDITTRSEFEEYIRFAKENYPDVLALNFEGSTRANTVDNTDILFNRLGRHQFRGSFGMHASETYPVGDDVKLLFRDPKYLEYVQWLNSLYLEGLIAKSQLIEQIQQSDERLMSAGYASTVGAFFNIDSVNNSIKELDGNDERTYVDVGPIQIEGRDYTVPNIRNKGYNGMVITKNAKDPERAIKFLEWALTDEGQTTMIMGVEGDTWDYVDGEKVMKQSAQDELNTSFVDFAFKYGILCRWVPFVDTYWWTEYADRYAGADPVVRGVGVKRLAPYVVDQWEMGFGDIFTALVPGSDEEIAYANIKSVMAVAATEMVVADSESELMNIYNAALAEIDSLGAEDVEAVLTAEHMTQIRNK